MLKEEMRKIFDKVQVTSAAHQRNIIILTDLYKKAPPDEFLQSFLDFLQLVVRQNVDNSIYTKRVLCFASRFCADITLKEEKENDSHDFFSGIIEKTLQWGCLNNYNIRYNSCCFIAMLLQDIGEEVQLEINLIDEIQKVMLERMQESKILIRLEAMAALVRLQDPQNFECPVIKAYIQALCSGSSNIRKDATAKIAPNMITLGRIRDRVRDADPTVRSVAFHKCADIGPLNFKIADKHMILLCGFKETNDKVKSKFFDYLLPKWLTAYRGDYLKFVNALKLVADEEDIKKLAYLSKQLIKEFYNKHPIDNIIAVLPINEEKLISVEDLANDVTLFWSVLVDLLRDSEHMEEHLNSVIPELFPFCHYIERVIKAKSTEKMDEWKFFEYQFDLLNLFEIAEKYDFSDEVGRRTMHSLTKALLQNNNFTMKVTKKLVSIAQKCSSSIDIFTHDMCQLISEIREPLIEEPLPLDQQRERDFKAAELRVKINILREKQNDAVQERDYQKAQLLDNELIVCNKQLENLQSQLETEKVRVLKSDNETLCHCLDILASVLELPAVNKMTPSLIACKDNFLIPLISSQGVEPHWRILKCLALFSIIDRATAEEYGKIIIVPIATYRTIPINNVSALIQSISGVTDLISLYGVDIVSQSEEPGNTTNQNNTTKRKLYNNENEEDMNARIDNMTLSYILEIFLDMLDDERDEIRQKSVLAITTLIKQSFPVTPTLVSRILLKWYSPLTAKQDNRLQVYLGLLIDQYMQSKNFGEVIKEAIVPTLSSIANAPRTSPLVDIDIDNMMLFLSEMVNLSLKKEDLRILALDLCMKISENTNDRVVPFLTKLLCHLDLHQSNVESATELIERAEMLLEAIKDKISKKYVDKFIGKLRLQRQTTVNTTQQTNSTVNTTRNEIVQDQEIDALQEIPPENEQNLIKQPQQVKRRKQRNAKNCVVFLEKLSESKLNHNETTLHTIAEASMEMELDEDLNIETPTTNRSEDSKSPPRINTVVTTETSDSDFSNDNEVTRRRSMRCRKKRIIHDI